TQHATRIQRSFAIAQHHEGSPLQRVLTASQEKLLQQERTMLEELRVQLARLGALDDDLTLLKQAQQQMDDLFLLVIAGEFNAGKSAFLNALLGEKLLAEGVTPTTSHIHILRYGDTVQQETTADEILVIQLPVAWLRNVSLVDTPGVNAVIQRHQEITEEFVPRSDLVLFVTSADRPFSESERQFLERIRQWSKKVVVIVNKIDLVETESDRAKILDFVRENGRHLFGADPQIFAVSARLAMQAKAAQARGEAEAYKVLWQASQFEALEQYVRVTLNDDEKLRLKLENPLGIATRLLNKYVSVINERLYLLRDDFETLDTIDEQFAAYERDMRRDFSYQSSRVENVLYEMVERGDKYFDDVLRLTRIMELVNSEKLRGEFEREVVGDTSRQIEQHVNDLIDWMVEKDYKQWRAVMEYMARRATHHADKIVGQVSSDFEFNRQNMLASVGREAQDVVNSYDREAESLKLAQEVQKAIIQTAALEVGALGLGALLVAVLHTTLLDITGIIGASAVAALGLYVLPYRRNKVKQELRSRINVLRGQLESALERQFEDELMTSIQRIREAIAPYTRFVRVEREKLERIEADLQTARVEVTVLRQGVKEIGETASATSASAESATSESATPTA
ncbi:MAG: dynamin family protein, partial [Caldilineaceae bacterium]|nr:dynamin family protein [Caldilineaceae bacterium]